MAQPRVLPVLPPHSSALEIFRNINIRRLDEVLRVSDEELTKLLMDCALIPSERRCHMCDGPTKKANGQSRSTLTGSLFEFLFRRQYRNSDLFYILLVFIARYFDGNISD